MTRCGKWMSIYEDPPKRAKWRITLNHFVVKYFVSKQAAVACFKRMSPGMMRIVRIDQMMED